MKTTRNGKPCYRWGTSGKVFPYKPGNAISRASARQRAMCQGGMMSKPKKGR